MRRPFSYLKLSSSQLWDTKIMSPPKVFGGDKWYDEHQKFESWNNTSEIKGNLANIYKEISLDSTMNCHD